MGNNENMGNKSSSTQIAKIAVPILIIIIIAGIFIIKNNQKEKEPVAYDGDEFALVINEADLVDGEVDIEKLKSYGLPILLDFGSDDCAPCRAMAPVLEEVNKELRGKAIVKFVDVWKFEKTANGYPLQVIPTQFFFDKDGKPFVPEDAQAMRMTLYKHRDTNEHVYTAHQGGMTKEQIMAVFKEMGVE